MNILVINCGSSSLKYQLIDMDKKEVLAKGLAERIGIEGGRVKYEAAGKDEIVIEEMLADHKAALKIVLDSLKHEDYGAVKSLDEIDAVGHRVVHGGEAFAESVVIDEKVMQAINDNVEIAPLHNPPNIIGIEACKEIMGDVPMVAVFDTAFHQSIPELNYIYALPYEYYENYKVRRYGFHGTSHQYITERAAEMLDKDLNEVNLITCHLGNGSSISAVKGGKCFDTSMGFTPLEGLAMGTRSGDLDPAIIPFIMDKEKLSTEEMNNVLNKKSGVLGVSGVSSDFRDLEEAAEKGNDRAQLALDIFENRVRKYIGAYLTEMDHCDGIIFTAGVGENSITTRERVVDGLKSLGVEIDKEKNNMRGKEAVVSTDASSIPVLVIPTNEELKIAMETAKLV
ncbi:acetate kinase [Aedoeadaptatus nemausensis]|uniref:Acetate kinase n=1 Tax=Aedoeadaptatus nemausensis TaxID=2582829 RepID=A0A6V6Y046_9FIRM|nr:acetate kinase [Peptoniphilus nemausensis]CAC9924853.1 acetate kinase [Peptoniphilus nemausensis]